MQDSEACKRRAWTINQRKTYYFANFAEEPKFSTAATFCREKRALYPGTGARDRQIDRALLRKQNDKVDGSIGYWFRILNDIERVSEQNMQSA